MTDKLFVVGLTGPTGAGKSEVARVLAEHGIPVLDADAMAREVVQPGSPCLAALAEEFSDDILHPDGSLNRRQLAKRAFATPEDTLRLNAITHPPIIALTEKRLRQLEQEREPVAAIDAPLLFESGMDAICDVTVAVLAPLSQRLARICARDGLTEQQAHARVAVQPEDAYYTQRATYVLHNEQDAAQLRSLATDLAYVLRRMAGDKGCPPGDESAFFMETAHSADTDGESMGCTHDR